MIIICLWSMHLNIDDYQHFEQKVDMYERRIINLQELMYNEATRIDN